MDLEQKSEAFEIKRVEVSDGIQERLMKDEIKATKEISKKYEDLRKYAKIKSRREFCGNYHRY
ncbi:MAG: hypothetical protein M1416_00830 [Candidatus Pacearchaeota archaeon]|nr:hypothetical protein [Candidatus Pacearchaeota archaeon]